MLSQCQIPEPASNLFGKTQHHKESDNIYREHEDKVPVIPISLLPKGKKSKLTIRVLGEGGSYQTQKGEVKARGKLIPDSSFTNLERKKPL